MTDEQDYFAPPPSVKNDPDDAMANFGAKGGVLKSPPPRDFYMVDRVTGPPVGCFTSVTLSLKSTWNTVLRRKEEKMPGQVQVIRDVEDDDDDEHVHKHRHVANEVSPTA